MADGSIERAAPLSVDQRTQLCNQFTALASTADATARLLIMGSHDRQSVQQDITAMRAMLTRISVKVRGDG